MEKRPLIAGFLAAFALASAAGAVECETAHSGTSAYTTCRVDTRHEQLRIFYAQAGGARFGSFARLDAALARGGHKLVFAMNAGMFHPDFRPVGLLVIEGTEVSPINRSSGGGNFYVQPNGVFLIDAAGPRVVATDEYRDRAPTFATQSGPMLLHRGQIPDSGAFRSKSRHRRNGVCVTSGSTVAFVISEDAVTFREFAQYFRSLGCTEALYLDGAISSLWSPPLGRADARSQLGPIVGVAE